jgi:thiosulfate reductase cytochrome b subunit
VSIAALARAGRSGRRLHPLAVRIMHWTNAVAMLAMITSGWGIYNDDVIIRGLHLPQSLRLGDWAA